MILFFQTADVRGLSPKFVHLTAGFGPRSAIKTNSSTTLCWFNCPHCREQASLWDLRSRFSRLDALLDAQPCHV